MAQRVKAGPGERLQTTDTPSVDHEVLIIGAGFGGIGAAIELQRIGVEDFLIVEKASTAGGTWQANTYPGAAVDIPSVLYSFSYEQRADWSSLFAPAAELRAYAEDVVDKHRLRSKIRFGLTVHELRFDEEADAWQVTVEQAGEVSELTARFVISGIGALERPQLPDIEGIDSFAGKVIHTSRWDHDADLTGKRVACIGTGASALQLIPEIAPSVGHLDVYQRTPIWVAPKVNPTIGPVARLVLSVPPVRDALRAAGTVTLDVFGNAVFQHTLRPLQSGLETGLRAWMRRQVTDRDVREALIPGYAFGCKRPSMSNTYLKAFNRPHVDLVTSPIRRITHSAIETEDGIRHPADILIAATGFKVMDPHEPVPFPIYGRDGVELGKWWLENRFQSYQGVSVVGFPNLFSIAGPYGFVVGSYFWMIEATTRHAARVIAETRRRGATRAEIRKEPHDEFVERMRRRQAGSPLFGAPCAGSNTYYVNFQGDSPLRPSMYGEMWWENRFFPIHNYRYRRPS